MIGTSRESFTYQMDLPHPSDRRIVIRVATDIFNSLLAHDHFPYLCSKLKIFYVYSPSFLGFYRLGTYARPHILLSLRTIYKDCCKFGVSFEAGIETTIVHELAHAIQDFFDLYDDEDEAENFARQWYLSRRVEQFWA